MPAQPSSIRGILFDLWNTLSYSAHQPNPMLLIAEALGIASDPGWKKRLERGMMTRRLSGIREALARLESETGRRLAGDAVRDRLVEQWAAACAATRLHDDAIPALRAARGRWRVGVLSNTQSFDLGFVRDLGIEELVDVLCLSCDAGRIKPDPRFFAWGARRLGLPAPAVLMVGDSLEDDVDGALRAGMAAVHLDRKGDAPAAPGARKVRLLTEVPSLLSGTASWSG
jgi:HAD superfamily hydrolase (TIGR01509 family)